MNTQVLDDLQTEGKRVLVRVDFNVPIRNGEITDDSRIVASVPTVQRLLDRGAKVILMSHLGRPKDAQDSRFSLAPVAQRLAKVLGKEVIFLDDCVGTSVLQASEAMEPGQIMLLENLRYHQEEEENDPAFSKQLAELGDLFVNDAFGVAHREHASTVGVTRHFSQAVAGRLLEQELRYLEQATESPEHPYVAILGGAKVSGKIDVLKNLLDKVDTILIGGGMVYTFYAATGTPVGDSLVEAGRVDTAREVLAAAAAAGVDLVLPVDSVVSTAADGSEPWQVSEEPDIPDRFMGVDLGPKTLDLFRGRVSEARTVVWNGPMGIFEVPEFSVGTREVARAVAGATERGATTIVGGGDSVAAIYRLGLEKDDYTHVSTGGGAFLEFLEGKELPGVAALTKRT